jgi:hypothetical protein
MSSSNSRSRSSERGRHQTKEKKSKKEKKDARRRRRERGPGTPNTASDEERGGGAAASAVAAAAPGAALALPTDNSVLSIDFVNSLANSINDLTRTMKDVQLGMQAMQRESQEQRGQIAAIVGELQSMRTMIQTNNTKYETEMATLNDDINTKLEQMKAASARLGAATAPPPSASSSSSAAAQAASASSGGPPAPGIHRPTRIWLKGFKETLTTKFLNEYARKALDRISPDLRGGAKPGAPGFGPVVYIDYPPGTLMAPIKAALLDLDLKHTDDAGQEHSIRVTSDQPLAVRHKGRVLGELWKLVEPYLNGLPTATRPKNFRLGNSNGKLFLVLDHRPLELFATTFDDFGTMHVTPNMANLGKYKVDDAMAQSWATAASRSAARVGQ